MRPVLVNASLTVTRAMMYHLSTICIHNCTVTPLSSQHAHPYSMVHMKTYILPVDIVIITSREACTKVAYTTQGGIYYTRWHILHKVAYTTQLKRWHILHKVAYVPSVVRALLALQDWIR